MICSGKNLRKCFTLSEQLFEKLSAGANADTAQYATLLGHRMRWKITMNAREAFHFLELRTAPQGQPGYRLLAKQMYNEIAKVHPRIAKHMIFINKDEDPELTRLAAERATQRKLELLDS